MAEYIKRSGLPSNCTFIITGDWHVGSKGFHEEAAAGLIERLAKERNTFAIFMADAIEGKKIDSPHFNPDSLAPRLLNIHNQADAFADMWKPVAKKLMALTMGNHELYLEPSFGITRYMAERIGVPVGGYQTFYDLRMKKARKPLRVFGWHGRPALPRGAKDPIQREANQKAWLVNRLAPLAGSCHVMLMAHTHALLVQEPVEQYALLDAGENVRARYFTEPDANVGDSTFVPVHARWYANTGTLRRSAGFGYTDYTEIAGYAPAPIGYIEMDVRDGAVRELRKVIL